MNDKANDNEAARGPGGNGPGAARPRGPWRSVASAFFAVVAVAFLSLFAFGAWLTTTSSGTAWLLGRVTLPEGLAIGQVSGSLYHGLVVERLSWTSDTVDVTTPRIDLDVAFGWGDRSLRLRDVVVQDLAVVLKEAESDDAPSLDPVEALRGAVAPLPIVLEQGRVAGGSVRRGAQAWNFEDLAISGRWSDALEALEAELRGEGLEARLAGDLALAAGRTDLVLDARVAGSTWSEDLPDDLRARVTWDGDFDRLPFELDSETAGLELRGSLLDLLDGPRADMSLRLERWVLETGDGVPLVLEDMEGTLASDFASLQGDLAGALTREGLPPLDWSAVARWAPGRVDIERVEGRSALGSVEAHGVLALEAPDPELDMELTWRDLRWPAEGAAEVTSRAGEGRLSGTPDAWRFSGAFDLETPGYPGGRFQLDAEGDRVQATVSSLDGQALGGRITADGQLTWSGAMAGNANFAVSRLDLGAVLPDWPAVLDARGAVALTGGESPALDLELDDLGGTFQGEPLDGGGRLAWDGRVGRAQDFRLSLGPSRLALDGVLSPAPTEDALPEARFEAELAVKRPGWVANRVGGELTGTLVVDTAQGMPLREVNLDVRELERPGIALASLTVRNAEGGDALRFEAAELVLGDTPVDAVSGTVAARGRDLALDAEALAGEWRLVAGIDGAWRGEPGAGLDALAWSGSLDGLALERAGAPVLSLRAPAPLDLSGELLRLEEACLLGPRDGVVCGSLSGAPGERLDVTLGLENLSLAFIESITELRLESTQRFNGEAGWAWRRDEPPSGFADIVVGAGEIGRLDDEDGRVATEAGFIGFRLDDGNLEQGRIELPFRGAGYVRADFRVRDMRLDGTGRVEGQLDLDLRSLAFLDSFVGQVDGIEGSLRSNVALGGTVGAPSFDGGFDLSQGRFEVLALGTSVEGLSLRGRVSGRDELTLRGRFQSGGGEGRLSLESDFADLDHPRFDLRLNGEDLAAIRLPDLDLDASPNLSLGWADGAWRVGGDLAVPRARIKPLTSFVSRVEESEDVVVVAGERLPVLAEEEARPAQVTGTMAVTLGDDVRLEVDNASLALSGGLDLAWNGAVEPIATGEVRVNGDVTAWGPRLNITDGRVRWDGGSVANPALDLQAERDVFGNTLVRTAGVRVSGTARRPDVAAYTRPLTTNERAWAVLLTGSDVNFAQGVGALDVGTYIAPRIFLSYGISLFDAENVVGLRYDLRRGWGIKATSGQTESGIDVSYTIED